MTPKRSNLSCKSHVNCWATKNFEFGHSLDVQREIYFHDGCFSKAPNISHTFCNSEMTWAKSKWWENHLPYLDLRQARDALCWFHMWDYDPLLSFHLIDYVSLALIPHDDDALIFVGDMI